MTPALSPAEQRSIAMQILTAKEYEAWDLVDQKNLSLYSASSHLNISVSSVRTRLAAARPKLARFIQSQYPSASKTPTAATRPSLPQMISSKNAVQMVIGLLIQRDGAACYLCRTEPAPDQRRIEHIIPTSAGGTDDPENLALACATCNGQKGTKFVSLRTTSGRPVYHPS